MTAESWLWDELREFFDTDDGSLPELQLNYVDRQATVAAYARLRIRARRIVTKEPSFWSIVHERQCSLDSVQNAAALVAAGDAEAFHVVLGGIRSRGVTIPDLGVFVFPDQVSFDYRMGPEWGQAEVRALFELLAELATLDRGAYLSLEEGVLPEVVGRFERVWRQWVAQTSALGPDT